MDRDDRRLHATIFLWLALVLYPCYALFTPPFQTPDEHQHLFRAYQLSRLQLIGEKHGNRAGGWVPPAFVRAAGSELDLSADHFSSYRSVLERPFSEAFARVTPVRWDETPVFVSNAALYSPAGYVPQVLSIWIGEAVGASVEAIVRLGRLLNAALAIGLMAWALRIAPIGRLPMMAVALLPVTAANAAAFGQDGVVIGAGFVLTALGLRVALRGRWTTGESLGLTAAGMVATLSKVLYAPLIAIALLPWPAKPKRWAWVGRIAAILVAAVLLLAVWLWAVKGLTTTARPDLPTWSQQWNFALSQPWFTAKSVVRAYLDSRLAKEIVGVFGWVNVGPSRIALVLAPMALLVAFLVGDAKAHLLGWTRRAWCLALSGMMALGLSFLMFLVYSPLGAYKVEGVQGRYLVPVLPLALIALLPARSSLPAPFPAIPVVAGLMTAASVASLVTILRAFYSF